MGLPRDRLGHEQLIHLTQMVAQRSNDGDAEPIYLVDPTEHADFLYLFGENRTRGINGDVPLYRDGFCWSTVVGERPRVAYFDGGQARAIDDGDLIAAGVVHEVDHIEDGRGYAVHVSPPY